MGELSLGAIIHQKKGQVWVYNYKNMAFEPKGNG
jgi:hypothetical protein